MRHCKQVLAHLFATLTTALLLAQNMPSMPSITSPAMPALSTSLLDSPQQNKASSTTEKPKTETKQTAMSIAAALANNMLGGNSNDVLGSILNPNSQKGFDGSTNLLLKQIIEQLADLQKKLPQAATQNDVSVRKAPDGTFLRFSVNNQNLLDGFQNIYFSQKSPSGAILITADRLYAANGKQRHETFYALLEKKTADTYTVSFDVTQDYRNEQSFLYRISQLDDLQIKQVANLYRLDFDSPTLKIDILFDR